MTPVVVSSFDLWHTIGSDKKTQFLTTLLKDLGIRGILTILRVRQTLGSIDIFPPGLNTIILEFNHPHSQTKYLTVGARALSKHCKRCSSGFWGDDKVSYLLIHDIPSCQYILRVPITLKTNVP